MHFRLAVLLLLVLASPALAAEQEGAAKEPAPIYVSIAPLSVPIVRGVQLQGRFDMQLVLEVENKERQAEVERLMPRLEAAYLANLTDLAQYYVTPGKAVDVALVARILQATTDRILGSGQARVLVQEAAIRR
ncbi:MAG: hypothetical protein D6807_00455 [Alphaproteobacteria bacterium]|nr:MAG: hypothetical protein D6807_00455 [Alphaproteobacteria bacterium]